MKHHLWFETPTESGFIGNTGEGETHETIASCPLSTRRLRAATEMKREDALLLREKLLEANPDAKAQVLALIDPPASRSTPERILLRFDLFKLSGKWAYGGLVEIANKPLLPAYKTLCEIDENQKEVLPGTVLSGQYHLVISDHPEQERNPNGSFFFTRMYTNHQIMMALVNAPNEKEG